MPTIVCMRIICFVKSKKKEKKKVLIFDSNIEKINFVNFMSTGVG